MGFLVIKTKQNPYCFSFRVLCFTAIQRFLYSRLIKFLFVTLVNASYDSVQSQLIAALCHNPPTPPFQRHLISTLAVLHSMSQLRAIQIYQSVHSYFLMIAFPSPVLQSFAHPSSPLAAVLTPSSRSWLQLSMPYVEHICEKISRDLQGKNK